MNNVLESISVSEDVSDLGATIRLLEQPSSASERSDQIDRAYEEYCNRLESGDDVDAEQFCARYPAFQTSLRRLVQAHNNLEGNPSLLRELASRWPEPGESFLGYRLLSELGRGAFARVFLAQELAVGGRLVAVKLSLHDDHEADTLGRMQHPNVVPIFSTQYDAGTGFSLVCMPFLGGTTLCHLIDQATLARPQNNRAQVLLEAARDPRWPGNHAPGPHGVFSRGSYIDGVLYLVEQLAAALEYVHGQGIVHRDLKPSNVLVCPNGVPVLLDFNLALDREVNDYRLGGTLPYMPPEQLQTIKSPRAYRAASADARTDLYGLGVILYELLAGAHPFGPVPPKLSTLAARDWLLKKQIEGPRPLSELNPEVDDRLAAFVERCLSADVSRRPATAHEVVAELRHFQTRRVRARRWARANWKSLTVASVLALLPAGVAAHYVATLAPAAVRNAESGDEALRTGRYADAIKAYTDSLTANPQQPDVRFSRGRAYMMLGKWDSAIKDFNEASPNSGKTAACLSFCLAAGPQPDFQAACHRIDDAIAAGFESAALLNNKAFCELKLGRFKLAIESSNRALTLHANLPESLLTRGIARWQLSNDGNDIALLRVAHEDLQLALAGGLSSGDSFLKSAWIAANLMQVDPAADKRALEAYIQQRVEQALQHGYPRQQAERDPVVGACARNLPANVGIVAGTAPVLEGLIDPLASNSNHQNKSQE